jgi:hypothetical protein
VSSGVVSLFANARRNEGGRGVNGWELTESSVSVGLYEWWDDQDTGKRHTDFARHVDLMGIRSGCVSNLLMMVVIKR